MTVFFFSPHYYSQRRCDCFCLFSSNYSNAAEFLTIHKRRGNWTSPLCPFLKTHYTKKRMQLLLFRLSRSSDLLFNIFHLGVVELDEEHATASALPFTPFSFFVVPILAALLLLALFLLRLIDPSLRYATHRAIQMKKTNETSRQTSMFCFKGEEEEKRMSCRVFFTTLSGMFIAAGADRSELLLAVIWHKVKEERNYAKSFR